VPKKSFSYLKITHFGESVINDSIVLNERLGLWGEYLLSGGSYGYT